jgi:hypothetical protein
MKNSGYDEDDQIHLSAVDFGKMIPARSTNLNKKMGSIIDWFNTPIPKRRLLVLNDSLGSDSE